MTSACPYASKFRSAIAKWMIPFCLISVTPVTILRINKWTPLLRLTKVSVSVVKIKCTKKNWIQWKCSNIMIRVSAYLLSAIFETTSRNEKYRSDRLLLMSSHKHRQLLHCTNHRIHDCACLIEEKNENKLQSEIR